MPSRHANSAQRWLARAHAVEPVLGTHANTNSTREKRVAEPWLPARRDKRPGGQRLTPDGPHNGGRSPRPERPPTIPPARSPPQGMHPKGTLLDPDARTPAPIARG